MNRNVFWMIILFIIFLFSPSGLEAKDPKRPNILLIVADDLGYSDIGSFGGEIATPALDSLAEDGVRFTNFHVLPTCSPTRSVLLSGMDNHRAGLGIMGEFLNDQFRQRADFHAGYAGYLNFEVAALPEVLKAGGYHTYMAGKWHLGTTEESSPHARGFEETFTLLQGGGSHWSDMKPLSPPETMIYRRNGAVVKSLPDDFYSLPDDFYSTRYYTDILLEWLKRDHTDGKPFFAYLSYTAPHDPLHAPKEYVEKYEGKYDQGWDVLRAKRAEALKDLGIIPRDAKSFPRLPNVKAWEQMSPEERTIAARDMEVYAAMVDYMDEQIQRMFNWLKENGEYNNTLILFISDNGANGHPHTTYPGQTDEYLGSFDNSLENRGLKNSYIDMGPGWAQASMAPSRMFKAFPTQGGIVSPLLVKTPGRMANAGSMNHTFFHIRDIMPTLLDLAGVDHTESFNGRKVRTMQGRSVLAIFEGKVPRHATEADRVGYELFGLKAFIDGDWKILWMPKPFGKGDWELFNLKRDPGELNDLGQQHPDKRRDIIALWEQYKADNGVLDISMDLSGKK
jgi:arylsulfatase